MKKLLMILSILAMAIGTAQTTNPTLRFKTVRQYDSNQNLIYERPVDVGLEVNVAGKQLILTEGNTVLKFDIINSAQMETNSGIKNTMVTLRDPISGSTVYFQLFHESKYGVRLIVGSSTFQYLY